MGTSERSADDRVRTGIGGLDEVLLGGIPRNNNILVEGAPGTGKTTLGLAFIHAGARHFDEPGVIISFELDPAKLMRDARAFGWHMEELVDAGRIKFIQTSPAVLLHELRSSDSALMSELAAIGARRLLIDGLTPLRLHAEAHALPFREDLHALVEGLTALGVTTLMTAERGDAPNPRIEHERYVFDTIISLTRHETRRRVKRRLTVEKSRGQNFIAGSHALVIQEGAGVVMYRRAQSRPQNDEWQPTSTQRASTGIPRLDELMGGGLYEGSITLVTGISGTGKTVAGVQFLCDAAARGKRGLFVSLDEHPAQLLRNAKTLDLSLEKHVADGTIRILYESPLELDLDVHFDAVVRAIEAHDVDCVVFDSVAVYETTSRDEAGDFLYALANYCKGRLATVYFNYESPELLGVSQISEQLRGSHLVDNIVLLNYVEISTRLRRALTVPKVRGSRNIQVTQEYAIGEHGLTIADEGANQPDAPAPVPQLPFSSYYGLLSRSPSRTSPAIEEAISQGAPLPPDSAPDSDGET